MSIEEEILRVVKRTGVLVAVTALTLALGVVPGANAAHDGTYTVIVGAPLNQIVPGVTVASESMRFLAPELNVHKGDTLTFQGGFHTATALPTSEQDADAWIATNMSLLSPYSLAMPDDEGEGTFKFNDNVVFPTGGFQCGIGDAPACEYDGSEVVNSGLLFFSTQFGETGPTGGYSMTINANPGDSFWVICLVHPNMRFKVNVIAPNTDASTQAQIDEYRDTKIAEDAAAANAIDAEYSDKHQSRKLASGKRLHQAWAGVDSGSAGGGVTVFEMYPDRLRLRKGDKVQWNFDELMFELHSATTPRTTAVELSGKFGEPVCDPDGTTGTAPDVPPNEDMTCTVGQLEFDLDPNGFRVLGDGKWRNDLESSGVRGAHLPPDVTQQQNPYTVKFVQKTGDKAAKFFCLIHPFMNQAIKVR